MKNIILLGAICFAMQASADEAQIARGQQIYKANCITCHGEKYDGMGDAGKYLNPHPRNLVTEKFANGEDVDSVYKSVTDGLKNTPMVAYKDILPEADRKAVAAFIVSLRKK